MIQPATYLHRPWRADDACGHEDLDAQHRSLVEAMEQISAAIAAAESPSSIYQRMVAAVQSCLSHFAREEAVFEQAAVPGARAHAALHRELEAKMRDLLHGCRDRSLETIEMTAALLYGPLVLHMAVEDRKLYPFLQQRIAGGAGV